MKLDNITKVTKENFDEVEAELCRYECQRDKERPAYRAGSVVGAICFWPLFVGALFVMGEIFPSKVLFPFLGCIAVTILGTFMVHLLAATAARLLHQGSKPPVPAEGNDLERAKALLYRAKAVSSPIPEPLVSRFAIFAVPLIFLVVAAVSEGSKFIEQYGIIFGGIIVVVAFAIGSEIIVWFPYRGYLKLCSRLYHARDGVPGLLKALEEYVRRLQFEEEKELADREFVEKMERNRLRGDALYRQATSGGTMDETLVAEAADLGSRPAALYMGRKMMKAWIAGKRDRVYTQAELEKIAKDGETYFSTAGPSKDYPEPVQTEVWLGFLVFRAATEDVSQNTLCCLRNLRGSGKLSKSQEYICDDAIHTAVDVLDYRAERDALREEARKSALTPSIDAIVARMRASSDSSSSWNTIDDDLDALSKNLPHDESWRDAE